MLKISSQFSNQRGAASQNNVLYISGIQESTARRSGTHKSLSLRNRSYIFLASVSLSFIIFWVPLQRTLAFVAHSEFSYIPLIPFISAFLVGIRRNRIFTNSELCPIGGGFIALAGILLLLLARLFPMLAPSYSLSLPVLALVTTLWGLFIFAFGTRAAHRALLPMSLLLFVVPAPQHATDELITFLQHGSAVLADSLFRLIGVPAIRDGMTISLPHLTIEVAPECSGIRSTLSLLVLTLAGANLYLRYAYNKLLLVSMLVPLSILKNAIRIVTLSTLAIYVDPTVLSGPVHHRGGILFFVITFTMLVPVVLIMRRCERKLEHRVVRVIDGDHRELFSDS